MFKQNQTILQLARTSTDIKSTFQFYSFKSNTHTVTFNSGLKTAFPAKEKKCNHVKHAKGL